MAAVIDYLDRFEIGLCLRVNQLGRTERVRKPFVMVSKLGDWGFWAIIAGVVFALQGPAAGPALLHVGLTALVGVAVYKLLKRCLVRERPFVNNGTIRCGTAPLDKYSFPSGHTLHAASFTVMYAQIEPMLLIVCVPFAVLVALSRVILGLHYPSDVLVGGALGGLIASLSIGWM